MFALGDAKFGIFSEKFFKIFCDGKSAVTITLFENFFSKNHPNLPLLSANIMRGLFEFFVNISELGRTNVFSRWE